MNGYRKHFVHFGLASLNYCLQNPITELFQQEKKVAEKLDWLPVVDDNEKSLVVVNFSH